MRVFDGYGPQMDVIAGPQVCIPRPWPGDLVESDALPVPELFCKGWCWCIDVPALRCRHDKEGRHNTWPKQPDRSAKCRGGKGDKDFLRVMGVYGLDGLDRQHEAGDDEEDVHHRPTREDDPEER